MKSASIKVEDLKEKNGKARTVLQEELHFNSRVESAYDRVLKLFREGMNEDVLLADLDRTHRLGGKKSLSSKPRSVIAKLARYNTREKVSKSQKNSKEKTLASQKILPNEFFK